MAYIKPRSVVVIGAGVTGLSTAFHLAEKGVERVIVVDKGTVVVARAFRLAASLLC
jgi:glycine/D-amino acid oxidase-like deaminating enzyme